MEDVKKEEGCVVEGLPQEFRIKHPLQSTWTVWYFENDLNKNIEENQSEITSFDAFRDFWSLYKHIKISSELRQVCDYSLFKKGVRTVWEDDVNKRRGRWLINLAKIRRLSELDKYWLEILLCMIGEAFDGHNEDVCRAVVNTQQKETK
jgi:translation initiation factor 4E